MLVHLSSLSQCTYTRDDGCKYWAKGWVRAVLVQFKSSTEEGSTQEGVGLFGSTKTAAKSFILGLLQAWPFFFRLHLLFLLPYHLFPLPLPVERPIGAHPRQQRHLLHQDRRQPFQGRILRIKLFVACFVEPSWVEPSSVELLKKTENKAILCFTFFV